MAVSAKDLAAKLGVSPSAVSLALNNKKGISDETRALILNAAEEYGLTRPVKKTTSTFINLVIFKSHGQVYGDTPFFSSVIEGISTTTAESGYKLQVTYFYGHQNSDEQIKMLAMSDCAGIILLATEMTESDILPFYQLPHPIVVLDSYFESAPFDSVVINNQQGAYLATRYLLDAGHRRLGHIASSVHINNFAERHDGFLKAIHTSPYAAQCKYDMIRVGSTQESAYQDISRYLDERHQLPTALFIDNDIIAISCIRALKEHGYQIPRDVSLIGFDNVPIAYVTSPKLTTVDVPKGMLGKCAVTRLLAKIKSSKPSESLKLCINTSLVIRDTVAPF